MHIIPEKKTILQFSKFIVVGVLNTTISLATFYLLYNLFSVSYSASNFISYVVGVINSFFWNKWWVFGRGNRHMLQESLVFLMVFAVSYSVQYGCLYALVEQCHIDPNWAQPPAMVVYTVVNYLLNRHITFKNKTAQ